MSENRSFAPPDCPPTAILNWSKQGAEFASRRGQALADYWAALAQARAAEEALTVQLDYWTHMIDDYAAAAAAAVAPLVPPANADHLTGGGADGAPRAGAEESPAPGAI